MKSKFLVMVLVVLSVCCGRRKVCAAFARSGQCHADSR